MFYRVWTTHQLKPAEGHCRKGVVGRRGVVPHVPRCMTTYCTAVCCSPPPTGTSVPFKEKLALGELFQKVQRCEEARAIVAAEMRQYLGYFERRREVVVAQLESGDLPVALQMLAEPTIEGGLRDLELVEGTSMQAVTAGLASRRKAGLSYIDQQYAQAEELFAEALEAIAA